MYAHALSERVLVLHHTYMCARVTDTVSRTFYDLNSLKATYFGKNAGFMPIVHTAGLLMLFGYTMEYSHLGKTPLCIMMITICHNHNQLCRSLLSQSVAVS